MRRRRAPRPAGRSTAGPLDAGAGDAVEAIARGRGHLVLVDVARDGENAAAIQCAAMEDAASGGIDARETGGAAGQRSAGGMRAVEVLRERPCRLGVGLVAQALELGGALAALPDAAIERERGIERHLRHPLERGAPVARRGNRGRRRAPRARRRRRAPLPPTRRLPRWRASRASRCPPRACGRSPRRARARPRPGCRPRARAGAPPPAVPRRAAPARSRARPALPDPPGERAATSRCHDRRRGHAASDSGSDQPRTPESKRSTSRPTSSRRSRSAASTSAR